MGKNVVCKCVCVCACVFVCVCVCVQYDNGFMVYHKIIVIFKFVSSVFINSKTHGDIFVVQGFPILWGVKHTNVQTHMKYIYIYYLHQFIYKAINKDVILFKIISKRVIYLIYIHTTQSHR